jgi:transcriptional regulator with XRE-family HTH domain
VTDQKAENTRRRRTPGLGRRGIPSKRMVPIAEELIFRRTFATRFRNARTALGRDQLELALQLGVSQGRMAHYETCRGLPRAYEIPLLCQSLNCDANYLLNIPTRPSDSRLFEALDNIVGMGAQHETTCDRAEHTEGTQCIWCEARSTLASYQNPLSHDTK